MMKKPKEKAKATKNEASKGTKKGKGQTKGKGRDYKDAEATYWDANSQWYFNIFVS